MTSPFLGIIAVAVLFVIALLLAIYRHVNRGKLRPGERSTISQAEYERNLKERDRNLYEEVERRKAQEKVTTNGTPVWFSRSIKRGDLKHWVIYIDGTKYELRRDETTPGGYTYMVTTDPGWSLKNQIREETLNTKFIPEVNEFYICLIGWTSKTPSELGSISADVMRQFGSYNIVWNNCQDYLQQFADIIIAPDKRALDWGWFRDHAKTEYQLQQKLPPTPQAVRERMIAAQMQNMQQSQQQNIQQQNFLQQQMGMSVAFNAPPPPPPPPPPMMMG